MSALHGEAGYWSLATLYIVLALSTFVAPSVSNFIGPRGSIWIGAIPYVIYVVGAAFTFTWLLIISAVLLGFGAALLWTGHGV